MRPSGNKEYTKSYCQYNSLAGPSRNFNGNNVQVRSIHPEERKKSTYKSKEKLQELCAANKCFICEEVGHMVKDCLKRNNL